MTTIFLFLGCFGLLLTTGLGEERVALWPHQVPNQEGEKKRPLSKAESPHSPLLEVTDPALIVYEPPSEVKNGASLLLFPGGGYNILAIEKEGYEVARWLSSLGYTAFVLQYRIPKNPAGALQDAQRAVRYVRATSAQRALDPTKIGVLGFSAGGSLAARLSSRHAEPLYPSVDAWDESSARPDFLILIYPAYLDRGENSRLTPELRVDQTTPPTFLFVTADDPYANSSLVMASALREASVGFELHVLPTGGHGYGMRPGQYAAQVWPTLCAPWISRTVFGD